MVSQWSSLACHPVVDDDVQSAWQIISNLHRSLSSISGAMGAGLPPEGQLPVGNIYTRLQQVRGGGSWRLH